jgi:biotin carboxylase
MNRRYHGQHLLMVSFTNFSGLPLVAAAHARGVRVTLLGEASRFEGNRKVADLADGRVVIGLEDEAALLAAAVDAHAGDPFTGIFVAREVAVGPAARVAAHLGIPWNTVASTDRVQDKWATRQTMGSRGFRQPEHALAQSTAEVQEILVARGGAWIVKPRRGTGSEGVSRVEVVADVAVAVRRLREAQPDGPFVVERAIEPAREYSVEGVWMRGEPVVLAITGKITTGPPRYIELGHTLPAELDPMLERAIVETATAGLRALGLSHGTFHVEVFVDDDGVVFGEGHARAGGDRITTMLEYAGLDLYGLAVDGLFATEPISVPEPSGAAAIRYFAFPEGRLESISGTEPLDEAPEVRFWRFDVEPGQVVRTATSSADRHGCVVVVAPTAPEADALVDRLVAGVVARLAPEPEPTARPAPDVAVPSPAARSAEVPA